MPKTSLVSALFASYFEPASRHATEEAVDENGYDHDNDHAKGEGVANAGIVESIRAKLASYKQGDDAVLSTATD